MNKMIRIDRLNLESWNMISLRFQDRQIRPKFSKRRYARRAPQLGMTENCHPENVIQIFILEKTFTVSLAILSGKAT